ncbi:hypothetical protein ACFVIM_22215 [Streptomyces sp. NPDC057638]|uniref:hypothetical protein n=1 Tax=Streptomyces sp. NPDC057638 TaxID=3346190 RepID=UPI0036B50688
MSGRACSYLCYVLAEGPVHGTGQVVSYTLGTFRTRSQDQALVWLQRQALWLADGLDPEPGRAPWASRCERVPVPDAPTEMRVWASDPAEERAARARLGRRVPVSVVIPDGPDRYILGIAPRTARTLLVRPFLVLQRRRGRGWALARRRS